MYKILFTGNNFSFQQLEELKNKGYFIDNSRTDLKENELIEALNGYDAFIMGGDEIATKEVIENSPSRLKLISFMGAGYEHYIDIPAAISKGISVTYTPAANSYSVAEYATALILTASKQIVSLNNDTKNGKWEKNKTSTLQGKTLGIFGMGAIGSKVATIMHNGYGMNIVYTSRTSKPDVEKSLKATKVELTELLKMSDVISIHASISDETRNTFGDAQFALMKSNVCIVNAARAEIIDGHALFTALISNKVAIAAYDVYYKEPIPQPQNDEYKLLTLPDSKFIITPHTAYNSVESVREMQRMILESITDYFEGNEVRHLVPHI